MDEVIAAIVRPKSRLTDVAAEFSLQPDSMKFVTIRAAGSRYRAIAVDQATHCGM